MEYPTPIFTMICWSPPLRFFKNLNPPINKARGGNGGWCALWRLIVRKNLQSHQALRSLLPTDKALQINIELSHYVAIMWKNCVIGNPAQLNPCEHGRERNEGETSLRPTMLPTGIKIAPDEILKTTRCKCVSTQCKNKKKTVQNYVIGDCQQCNDQSDMHMNDN